MYPTYICIFLHESADDYITMCKRKSEEHSNILKIVKVKLATLVHGNKKAPFSIATTLMCRGRVLLLFLDCFTLPLMRTLYCWVLSKEELSTIFKVFGMTRPGVEPRYPGPLANTLSIRPMKYSSKLTKAAISISSQELGLLSLKIVVFEILLS